MAKKIEPVETTNAEINAPYELPEGWTWVKQSEVCKLVDGEKISGKDFPYLEVKYLRGKKDKEIVNSGKFIKQGTKVILVDGENSGEVFTVFEDGFMGSTFKALSIQNVDENYLQFFISTKKDLYKNNKKGSAIPHLNKDLFFNMPFPLPPTLTEQTRIVSRIESLFSKLDSAKEKAQNVVDSFENRKAAILNKAFTGKLTKKWRAENGVGEDSWEEKTLGEIITFVGGGTPDKSCDNYWNGDIPWASVKDIKDDYLYETQDYITEEGLQNSSANLCNENDIILITRISPGKATISKIKTAINQDLKIVLTEQNKVFIRYYFTFNEEKINSLSSGTTVKGIKLDQLNSLEINLPTLPEQTEIVRILDIVLEKENKAKEAAEAVLEQIELLKKSILARAFRGEL